MRTFKEFPKGKDCPICKTDKNKECVLITVEGTGDNPEAKFQNFEAKSLC